MRETARDMVNILNQTLLHQHIYKYINHRCTNTACRLSVFTNIMCKHCIHPETCECENSETGDVCSGRRKRGINLMFRFESKNVKNLRAPECRDNAANAVHLRSILNFVIWSNFTCLSLSLWKRQWMPKKIDATISSYVPNDPQKCAARHATLSFCDLI